jgi:hypothetical protein
MADDDGKKMVKYTLNGLPTKVLPPPVFIWGPMDTPESMASDAAEAKKRHDEQEIHDAMVRFFDLGAKVFDQLLKEGRDGES